MRLIAFPQWDKLTSLLRSMARQSAADYAQRKIVRIIPKNGVAHISNYAANLLAVEGGTTAIVIPTAARSAAGFIGPSDMSAKIRSTTAGLPRSSSRANPRCRT